MAAGKFDSVGDPCWQDGYRFEDGTPLGWWVHATGPLCSPCGVALLATTSSSSYLVCQLVNRYFTFLVGRNLGTGGRCRLPLLWDSCVSCA